MHVENQDLCVCVMTRCGSVRGVSKICFQTSCLFCHCAAKMIHRRDLLSVLMLKNYVNIIFIWMQNVFITISAVFIPVNISSLFSMCSCMLPRCINILSWKSNYICTHVSCACCNSTASSLDKSGSLLPFCWLFVYFHFSCSCWWSFHCCCCSLSFVFIRPSSLYLTS